MIPVSPAILHGPPPCYHVQAPLSPSNVFLSWESHRCILHRLKDHLLLLVFSMALAITALCQKTLTTSPKCVSLPWRGAHPCSSDPRETAMPPLPSLLCASWDALWSPHTDVPLGLEGTRAAPGCSTWASHGDLQRCFPFCSYFPK